MPELVLRRPRAPAVDPLVAAAQAYQAAQIGTAAGTGNLFNNDTWQADAWRLWRTVGEFSYGTTWRAAAISRVRLIAAEEVPGGEEPEPLTTGPAAELMEQFCGGTAGRAAFLAQMSVQWDVPGEGWLVAERADPAIPLVQAEWCVYPKDGVRASRGFFEVRADENLWRPLAPDALPMRIWNRDPQFPWRAWSTAQPALPILRRIELLDRRIVAMLVSRLAMNGLMLIPQEAMIPTLPAYAKQPDPFIAMLIDIAAKNIANPGNASAAIPIPIRYPADFIEKWRHITFGDLFDEQLLVERSDELARLATTMNLTAERLTGQGDVNHWGISQMEEGEIKTSINPTVEPIASCVAKAYLHPMLLAGGERLIGPSGGLITCWYDTSELTAKPDKTKAAHDLYVLGEASGRAARREAGLDESDAPTPAELADWGWKRLAGTVELGPTAIAELSGQQTPGVGASGPAEAPAETPTPTAPAPGAPPDTQNNPAPDNPAPPQQQAAAMSRLLRLAAGQVAAQQGAAEQLAALARGQGELAQAVAAPKLNGRRRHVGRHRQG